MRTAYARAAIGAALLAPVAGLAGYLALSGDDDGPERLPITLAGGFAAVTYDVAPDLPELAGEAPAYELERPDAGDVEALAAAFGLGDDVEVEDNGIELVVRTGDAFLAVSLADTSGSWRFQGADTGGGDATGGAAGAVAALMDLAGYEADEALVDDPGGDDMAVTATPRVDGLAVAGMSWIVELNGDGSVRSASGFLGRPERVGTFPLVSTAEGVERLNTGQSGGFGMPVDFGDASGGPAGAGRAGPETTIPPVETIVVDPVPPTTLCPPEVCTSVPVGGVTELVQAEPGLMLVPGFDGRSYLVPAHLFTGAGGELVPTVAVASERLGGAQGGPVPAPGEIDVVPLPAPPTGPPPTTGTTVPRPGG